MTAPFRVQQNGATVDQSPRPVTGTAEEAAAILEYMMARYQSILSSSISLRIVDACGFEISQRWRR